jgi:hypothetical protein
VSLWPAARAARSATRRPSSSITAGQRRDRHRHRARAPRSTRCDLPRQHDVVTVVRYAQHAEQTEPVGIEARVVECDVRNGRRQPAQRDGSARRARRAAHADRQRRVERSRVAIEQHRDAALRAGLAPAREQCEAPRRIRVAHLDERRVAEHQRLPLTASPRACRAALPRSGSAAIRGQRAPAAMPPRR